MSISEMPAVLAEISRNYSRYSGVMARVRAILKIRNAWARAQALTALVAVLDRWEGPSGIR